MLRGIRSGAQEQNKLEIDLALRTLEFFGRLARTKKIEVGADTRTVAACLCDWQDRWAQPILMPLTGKMDMAEPLQTPRPARALLSLGYLHPVEGVATIAADDGLVHEGKAYCFAGKATWQSLVQQGKLTGADAVAPQRSAFCWLQKLFNLFATVKFDEDEAAIARRIASCWYYTATECNFDESDEIPENDKVEPIAPQQLLGMLFAQAPPAAAGGDDDGDDDDEGEESLDNDNEEGNEGDEDGEDDDEDEEEEEEEEEEQDVQPPPEKKSASSKKVSFAAPEGASLTNELMKDADADEEDDEEFEPEEDEEEEEEEGDELEEETEQAKEIRTAVLKGVEAVNAYLPPPSTDMLYFKRMLLRMQAQDEISKRWFPWGVPPWEPLKTAIKSSDPLLQNYATEILRLFAQQGGSN